MKKMDQEILELNVENEALKEDKKIKDVNCWEWLEKRYDMLKMIPSLTEENKSLKNRDEKFKTDIKNLNKRINELDTIIAKKITEVEFDKHGEIEKNFEKLSSNVELTRKKLDVNNSRLLDIENNSQWGKMERVVNENLENNTEKQEEAKIKRNVVIIGDSMLKHIDVEKLFPGSKSSRNECMPGATVEKLNNYVSRKNENDNQHISDVIVHAGSNNLPRDDVLKSVNKLASLLEIMRKKYKNASITFSPIIPKYDNKNIATCDEINNIMRRYCKNNGIEFIETRNLVINKNGIRFERLSRHDLLHLNREGIIMPLKSEKHVAICNNFAHHATITCHRHDSSNLDRPDTKLFHIMTPSAIGALPLSGVPLLRVLKSC